MLYERDGMIDNVTTETRSIRMHYDIFESTIISCLYALGAINDDTDVVGADFALPVDENDMVEFDIEVAVPRTRPAWSPRVIES